VGSVTSYSFACVRFKPRLEYGKEAGKLVPLPMARAQKRLTVRNGRDDQKTRPACRWRWSLSTRQQERRQVVDLPPAGAMAGCVTRRSARPTRSASPRRARALACRKRVYDGGDPIAECGRDDKPPGSKPPRRRLSRMCAGLHRLSSSRPEKPEARRAMASTPAICVDPYSAPYRTRTPRPPPPTRGSTARGRAKRPGCRSRATR
jgi:hypothetical protein